MGEFEFVFYYCVNTFLDVSIINYFIPETVYGSGTLGEA